MKKSVYSFLLLCLIAFLPACSPDNPPAPAPEPAVQVGRLTSRKMFDSLLSLNFFYENKTLTRIENRDMNGNLMYLYNLAYDAKGRLTSVKSNSTTPLLNNRCELQYNNAGQVSKVIWQAFSFLVTYSYTYDAKGKVTQMQEVVTDPKTKENTATVFTLEYDGRGNVIRRTSVPAFPGQTPVVFEYQYDNSFNYVSALNLPPLVLGELTPLSTPNNLTKMVLKVPGLPEEVLLQRKYEYDSKGRVSRTKLYDEDAKAYFDYSTDSYEE